MCYPVCEMVHIKEPLLLLGKHSPMWRQRVSSLSQRRTQHILFTVIWRRTYGKGPLRLAREETRCRHMSYSFRLTTRVLLYASSLRQDNTYNGLCYTSRGALAGTRNSSMGPPHEGSIRRPIAPMSERSYHGATSRS